MSTTIEQQPPRTSRRLFWLSALAVLLLLSTAGLHWASQHLLDEGPNYAKIEPRLWLGALVDEPPPGTRAVLNLCELKDSYRADVHEWQPIRDAGPAPTLDWLKKQVAFVDAQQQAKRITYVHCLAGISRSAMVVTAYLMQKHRWTRDEALTYVRTKRAYARPNPVFMELLTAWEKSLAESRKDAP